MRVVHIITRLILGGAQENTLFNCADLIREYGDEVTLVTGPGLGPEGSLEDQARRMGVPLVVLPQLRRNIHPTRDASSYWAIKRALRALRPEVVHTHSGKAGLLGRMAAHALRVPAVVHTVHGAPFHAYQGRGARLFFRACERHAARRCHALISVADAMTSQMVAARVAPREKFTTIYSGMDVEPFLAAHEHRQRARREFGFGDDDVVVGKIARLFHLKGHEDLIAAARLVVGRHPHLKFLFVGDGVLRPRLEAQIAEAGLADHFRFAGLVPPERIPELIGAMDVVVHTSLREGLARVLPQGLIAGKPVVSYDIDGAREVV
jgi:glycosyltransferase involved in cell wall biosynthesis